MPRSPSPRGYRDPPARPTYRDRPFRPAHGQAGPSRYHQGEDEWDRDRRGGRSGYGQQRGHERDQPPFDRNEGRTWGNYHSRREGGSRGGGGGGYGGRGRSVSRSRSRSAERTKERERDRSRSLSTDRHRSAGRANQRAVDPERSRTAAGSARASNASKSPPRSRAAASASPEEGQITSPHLSARGLGPRLSSPGPSYQRRRTPSPTPRRDRWDDRDRQPERDEGDRFVNRSAQRNWGGSGGGSRGDVDVRRYEDSYRGGRGGRGGRGVGRDTFRRDSDRGWGGAAAPAVERGRERDSDWRRSRSPLPPQDRYSRRSSRSPSTASSFRSSRFDSPDKRRSPVKGNKREVSRSPLPPARDRDIESPARDRSAQRDATPDRKGRDQRDIATPPPPPPPASTSMSTASAAPFARPVNIPIRQPPAGPRSDRIPSGPRGFIQPLAPPPPPPPLSISPPVQRAPASPPHPPPPPPAPAAVEPPPPAVHSPAQSARLSWSERKKIASPITPTFAASTIPANTSASGSDAGLAVGPGPNPYSQPIVGSARPSPSHGEDTMDRDRDRTRDRGWDRDIASQYQQDQGYRRPFSRGSMRVDTPSSPSSRPRTPSPPPPPRITEEELAARRQKEEEARIIAELPVLKVGYSGSTWEREVERHYATIQPLEVTTLRAQASLRMAKSILTDVELERMAMMERVAICEAHLKKGSMGLGVLGGV